jgi:hypothetical protein
MHRCAKVSKQVKHVFPLFSTTSRWGLDKKLCPSFMFDVNCIGDDIAESNNNTPQNQ